MNFIAWCLALGILTAAAYEAVLFQQATVCRQKAWLKGAELQTRTLLHNPSAFEQRVDRGCKVYVTRKSNRVTWQRLPNPRPREFKLRLQGKI